MTDTIDGLIKTNTIALSALRQRRKRARKASEKRALTMWIEKAKREIDALKDVRAQLSSMDAMKAAARKVLGRAKEPPMSGSTPRPTQERRDDG